MSKEVIDMLQECFAAVEPNSFIFRLLEELQEHIDETGRLSGAQLKQLKEIHEEVCG